MYSMDGTIEILKASNTRLKSDKATLLSALENIIQSISDDPDYPLDEPYLSARTTIKEMQS